jgi:hypothetical protein
MSDEREDQNEMILLAKAAKDSGIPLSTLHSARKQGRLWAERREEIRGPVWYTTLSEIERFKKTYTPHKDVKNL